MFTGIIEAVATVVEKNETTLMLSRPDIFDQLYIGQSIAVSGVCLSVIAFDNASMTFNVIPQTWNHTKLGLLTEGRTVNVERAMPANGRFDGHIVQGHSEGVGVVQRLFPPSPTLPPEGEGSSVEREQKRKKPIPKNIRFYAREMRKNPTEAEEKLWKALRDKHMNVRFRRQHPVGGHILDFYCHEYLLGIELDGEIHNTEDQQAFDERRTQYLHQDYNISIIRFSNKDVLTNFPSVLKTIQQYLHTFPQQSSPPPSGEGLGEGAKQGQEGEEKEAQNTTQDIRLTIQLPPSLLKYVIPKGSITIDGVSLTVADIQDDLCTVALIPHTLQHTTLGRLQEGDQVNIETDIVGKYVENMIAGE